MRLEDLRPQRQLDHAYWSFSMYSGLVDRMARYEGSVKVIFVLVKTTIRRRLRLQGEPRGISRHFWWHSVLRHP